jgi:menaquinone-specific isochorismate synthase
VMLDSALAFLAQKYPETYRFLFEPRPYHAFYGATPELLATVDGLTIQTMALAGSIKRGTNQEEDEAFAQELFNSAKDRYEHDLVIQGIRSRLENLTSDLHFGETAIMSLSNIQHLYTPVTGKLKHNDGILPIVAALHPTPALGGDPREVAMKLISEYEAVPRGWYAAPVGWIDRKMNGQFGVAIRSAVAQDKRVWLYSGAGIVKDSQPQKEWDETGWKFRPMLNALGIKA